MYEECTKKPLQFAFFFSPWFTIMSSNTSSNTPSNTSSNTSCVDVFDLTNIDKDMLLEAVDVVRKKREQLVVDRQKCKDTALKMVDRVCDLAQKTNLGAEDFIKLVKHVIKDAVTALQEEQDQEDVEDTIDTIFTPLPEDCLSDALGCMFVSEKDLEINKGALDDAIGLRVRDTIFNACKVRKNLGLFKTSGGACLIASNMERTRIGGPALGCAAILNMNYNCDIDLDAFTRMRGKVQDYGSSSGMDWEIASDTGFNPAPTDIQSYRLVSAHQDICLSTMDPALQHITGVYSQVSCLIEKTTVRFNRLQGMWMCSYDGKLSIFDDVNDVDTEPIIYVKQRGVMVSTMEEWNYGPGLGNKPVGSATEHSIFTPIAAFRLNIPGFTDLSWKTCKDLERGYPTMKTCEVDPERKFEIVYNACADVWECYHKRTQKVVCRTGDGGVRGLFGFTRSTTWNPVEKTHC